MLFAPYYRVSHKDKERGISIDVQREAVEHWAAQIGHTLTKPYIDDGKSAYTNNLAKRPAFQQMLADAQARQFQGIIVYKYDRFARRLHIYASVIEDLRKRGISVESATESNDPFMVDMLGVMAQHYSRMLSARMKDVRRWEASQGRHVGPVPIGYDRVSGVLVPNNHAAAYKLAVELRVTGEHGTHVIATALNAAGYTMPSGTPFKVTQVEEMLKNPVYAGFVTLKGETFQGKHEPLIDLATWERLQEVERQRSRRRTRPAVQHEPLLAGLGVCASCGAPLWHQPYPSGHRYYTCSTMLHKGAGPVADLICIRRKSSAEETEARVLAWLGGLAFTPGLLEDAQRHISTPATAAPVNQADIERRLKQLARAYGDGAYSDEEYRARKVALQSKLNDAPAVTPVVDQAPCLRCSNTYQHSSRKQHSASDERSFVSSSARSTSHGQTCLRSDPQKQPRRCS